jgi:hypothetical protein
MKFFLAKVCRLLDVAFTPGRRTIGPWEAEPVTFPQKPANLAQWLHFPGEKLFLSPIAFVSLAPSPQSDRGQCSQVKILEEIDESVEGGIRIGCQQACNVVLS